MFVLAASDAADVRAQGALTIRGVVYDSLRSGAPVAGAEVVLFGTGRRDTTDARGRFAFAGVSAGSHAVGYWAPWLDSLAVPALRSTIEVARDGRDEPTVLLATPSPATAQRALCGTTLEKEMGVLLGEVRAVDRVPQERAAVYVWWNETVLGKGRNERRTLASADTTGADGMYVLCGIPLGAELEVHSDAAAGATAALKTPMDALLKRLDLTVGGTGETMPASGRVVTGDRQPVAGAKITHRGDSTVSAFSEDDGTFSLRVPSRTGQLVVRALGYGPFETRLEPDAEGVALGDIVLRTVQELAPVNVTATGVTVQRLEFDERRKFNFQGTFFDDEELKRLPIIRPIVLKMKVPRSHIDRIGNFYLERNGGWCKPRLFVDGVDYGADDQFELRFWMERAKRIEVYRAAFSPAKYNDFDGCGVVVISTR